MIFVRMMMMKMMTPKISKLLLDKREEELNLKPQPRSKLPPNNPRKTKIKKLLPNPLLKAVTRKMMMKMMMRKTIAKMFLLSENNPTPAMVKKLLPRKLLALMKMKKMMRKDLMKKLNKNLLNKKKSSLVTFHLTLMRLLSNKDLKNTEPLLTLRSHLSKERAKVSHLLNSPSQLRPRKPSLLSMEPTLMVELSKLTSQLINQLEEVAMKLVPEPVEVEIVLENPLLFSVVTLDLKPKLLTFKTSSLNAEKLRM
jgi:hypothetical protein